MSGGYMGKVLIVDLTSGAILNSPGNRGMGRSGNIWADRAARQNICTMN